MSTRQYFAGGGHMDKLFIKECEKNRGRRIAAIKFHNRRVSFMRCDDDRVMFCFKNLDKSHKRIVITPIFLSDEAVQAVIALYLKEEK